MNTEMIVLIIEIIGTIAFASSGAMVGIRRSMDVFGVIVMAITTAVGGGIIRDLILGIHPPSTFQNPIYVIYAVITALLLFIIIYFNKRKTLSHFFVTGSDAAYTKIVQSYERFMNIMDAIGLGAFTVIGVQTAWKMGYQSHWFLLIFVGMITGVGGGALRDMMALQMPFIFVKHIYACASLTGAVVCIVILPYHQSVGMITGAVSVIIIRLLATKYHWNLPRIQ